MKKVYLIALIFILLLSGCGGNTQSGIFALPEMPETQSALLETVSQVCLDGFEFAEPRSGVNRYPVQLVDLDGNGEDEGIVFLRDILGSYKTYVYIFEQTDSVFTLFDVIEGREKDIYTVSYSKVLGGDGYELIVKWGAEEKENHSITAHTLTADGMEKTLDISAGQFSVSDISGDGENELLAVAKRDGRVYADIYSENSGEISRVDSVALSQHEGKVTRILSGKVSDSVNGAFIERESPEGTVTDVITYGDGRYVNILPEGDVCGVRALCADINNDGRIEIPQETEKDGNISTDRTYLWRSIDGNGVVEHTAFTYHSFAENWYLSMPISWSGTVFARRESIDSRMAVVSFFTREEIDNNTESYVEAPLFNVYVCRGSSAAALDSDGENIILAEREDVTFVGEIISTGYLGETIDEGFLKEAFRNRKSDWASEILFA